MPSPQTNPDTHRRGSDAPRTALAPYGSEKTRRWSQVLAIAVTCLAMLGGLVAIPVVRAVFPAVLNSVAPVMIRAVVRAPTAAPAAPPQKTTACTHKCVQAGPSHRHICS